MKKERGKNCQKGGENEGREIRGSRESWRERGGKDNVKDGEKITAGMERMKGKVNRRR